MPLWRGWRGRVAGALAMVALAGCGTLPAAAAAAKTHPTATQPAVSRSDPAATKPRASGPAATCPAWLVKDVKVAAAAKLPVPTVSLQGLGIAGPVTEQTVKAWLGGSPSESVGELLQGWTIHGLSARRGSVALTLSTYAGRHLVPVGHAGPGTALTLSEPSATPGERTWIQQDGFPPPPASAPVQLAVTVGTLVSQGTLATELGAFLAALQGGRGTLADMYPVAVPAPTGYTTYSGPFDLANLLRGDCVGEPVAATVPDLVSGAVVQMPYWSSTEGNGISIGFAPGHVVVESENDAMTQVAWYAEPAITVPPTS